MYKPNPVNTTDIVLPEDLIELIEQIAENVHENWSEGRMLEGWVYGNKRDDVKKTTPCLVPEKEYDRKTAVETLKLIVALGYKITKE